MKTAAAAIGLLLATSLWAQERGVEPVLAFPVVGMDDTAAYRGYQTRFFRDSRGNVVQIYLDGASGRVVHVWADAANESIGFTVRGTAGRPAPLSWESSGATVADSGASRTLAYTLRAAAPSLEIGWFQLGSMRVERDVQYAGAHLRPFGAAFYRQRELEAAVAALARLAPAERRRHLALLGATDVAALRARLDPTITLRRSETSWVVRVSQPSFDGKNRLTLEMRGDPRQTSVGRRERRTVALGARGKGSITLAVRIVTDAEPLTPLARDEIFSAGFLDFLARERATHDSLGRASSADSVHLLRYPWLEREVRGVELLSSEQKLMAGMPTFATYFGRDMMMSALMMRAIWTPAMSERVIASVLRKLGPRGDVSHEEALGGQAIREAASEYAGLLDSAARSRSAGDAAAGSAALARARALLGDLQRVRENYHMMDDEFHLPVLTARYLSDAGVTAERKRAFLDRPSADGETQLARLLRELALVAAMTAPYAREHVAENLVAFPKRDSTHFFPGSWRDSNVGYANGRFAMDINAIWAPHALHSLGVILAALRELGYAARLDSLVPAAPDTTLREYARNPEGIVRAEAAWREAWRHFVVTLAPEEVQARVRARLEALPPEERDYWRGVVAANGALRDSLSFLAISLDSAGRPIPVENTDPGTWLFLGDPGGGTPGEADSARVARLRRDAGLFARPYPIGLLVNGLGPVAANDAYASPAVWEMYRNDLYHSPRVVWGREVNLFLLGVAGEIPMGALDGTTEQRPYVNALVQAMRRVRDAVEASGLKHAELWSYRIQRDRLHPERYGTSGDIQLWSTTDLAVQYALARLAAGR